MYYYIMYVHVEIYIGCSKRRVDQHLLLLLDTKSSMMLQTAGLAI